jgi:hypothetical protein
VVESPVAGVLEARLVRILAVILGDDLAVRARQGTRSFSAVPLLHLIDDSDTARAANWLLHEWCWIAGNSPPFSFQSRA